MVVAFAALMGVGLVAGPAAVLASSGRAPVATRLGSSEQPAPPPPTRVLLLGDSVMEGAATAIPAALGGREVVVDTEVSRSTGATADAGARHGDDWDVVAVLVGHNDAGSAAVYQPAYTRLLDEFPSAPRIAVLTLHEVRPGYGAVNAFLRDQAARRANVRVVEWGATVDQHPGSVAHDGLHLTPSGARLMALTIAQQVQDLEAQRAASNSVTATTTSAVATAPSTLPAQATVSAGDDGGTEIGVPMSIDREPPPIGEPEGSDRAGHEPSGSPSERAAGPGADRGTDRTGDQQTPLVAWILIGLGLVGFGAWVGNDLARKVLPR